MIIYAFVPMAEVHASYYYRMLVPLQTMEALGLPVEILIDDCTAGVPPERRRDGLMWSDIVWMYQATDPLLRHNIQIVSNMNAHHDNNGKLWYPANFIVDTDDDLFNVSPLNWAFKDLGIKDGNGQLLHPSSDPTKATQIEYFDGDGNVIARWKDGEGGFSIYDNITKLENYRSLCQAAGIMTCSSPVTEAYAKREMGKKLKTFVNPNGVRFDHYQDVALAPHKEIRIMWQGSNTHYEDIFFVHKVLARVAKKYPEAKFIFWGHDFGALTAEIPREQFEYIPWMSYDKYHLRLVTVGPDINLCPLMPSPFGSSRSAIKFYEGSLLHDPAATIAQKTGAYAAEIQHEKTGLLYETEAEFEEHLCRLIEDEKTRRELAANAKDWVHQERDAFKLAPKLFEFFEQVRDEKRETTEIEVQDAPVPTEQPDIRPSED